MSILTLRGFEWPVTMTAGAWADCVPWSDRDSQAQVYQDQSGRLCYITHEVLLF